MSKKLAQSVAANISAGTAHGLGKLAGKTLRQYDKFGYKTGTAAAQSAAAAREALAQSAARKRATTERFTKVADEIERFSPPDNNVPECLAPGHYVPLSETQKIRREKAPELTLPLRPEREKQTR